MRWVGKAWSHGAQVCKPRAWKTEVGRSDIQAILVSEFKASLEHMRPAQNLKTGTARHVL